MYKILLSRYEDGTSGYELEDITLFDMFPNTNHVECVCLLKLK